MNKPIYRVYQITYSKNKTRFEFYLNGIGQPYSGMILKIGKMIILSEKCKQTLNQIK